MIKSPIYKSGMPIILCMLLLWASGCAPLFKSKTPEPDASDEPTKITLTPVDLFKGDAAKFRPFLGMMSGGFQLRYEGKKPNAKLDIDIWENGKKTASYGSIGDLFHTGDRESREIEVIVSIETISNGEQDEFYNLKVGTVRDSGTSLASFTLPRNKSLAAQGIIQHHQPLEFTAGKPVHVWGMQATRSNEIHTADFSQESLSNLEWSLIITRGLMSNYCVWRGRPV